MNQPAQTTGADAFFTALRGRTAHGQYSIDLGDGELPASVELRDTPYLIFTFTGALKRDSRPLPQFATGRLKDYVPASFIRLADPSLFLNDELRVAWYAGHEGFELQKRLPEFLHQIIDSLGATRVVFIGMSGGGFASLYYSWTTPGSVAIAVNPQTNLNRYQGGALRARYRKVCWPALDENASLDTVIHANLRPLYRERCANTAVILQTASDFGHLTRQLAPFISEFPSAHRERLIVQVADWGVQGHKPAPANIWIPWVTAALSADDTSAPSIEAAWAAQGHFQLPPLKPLSPAGADERIAADLARAALDSLLGQQARTTRQP